ncbi:MAG: Hsp70 family protein [Paracoccaceae bacterium]
MGSHTLGIDFGTSNSAAGVAVNGVPFLIDLEPGETTLPTAVFFDLDTRSMAIGRKATKALIAGDEGRFMRALKSLLGTSLMREKRRLYGEELDFIEIVARFLRIVKSRAEAQTGLTFDTALSGRPVRFHSKDETRNQQAEIDLRDSYLAAGFKDVRFMFEPEAALRSAQNTPGIGLIVDIGGGTSDFTVFDQPDHGKPRVLTSYGVRVGGTDFDRLISIDHVMPLLGRGTEIRNSFGKGTLPAPNRIFNELATWQMIPFLYTADKRRVAKDLHQNAVERVKLHRLVIALQDELGHDIAFAVEHGKIEANRTHGKSASINLSVLETGLEPELSRNNMNNSLNNPVVEIEQAARAALVQADVRPEQVSRVVMVGGASLMGSVQSAMTTLCPEALLQNTNAMTAVADGLALAAPDAF